MNALARITIVCLGLMSPQVWAQNVTLTPIANSDTVNPGGTPSGQPQGTLMDLWQPRLDGNHVLFRSRVSLGPGVSTDGGYFLGDGGPLTVVADAFTPWPGVPAERIQSMWGASYENGEVAFTGQYSPSPLPGGFQNAIIHWQSGVLSVKVDRTNPAVVPGGINPFNGFGAKAIDLGGIAFVAYEQTTYTPGLYFFDGLNVNLVANPNTPLPGGGGNFERFDSDFLATDAGVVAFLGEDTNEDPRGIYFWDGMNITALVEQGDPTPGGLTSFDLFYDLAWQDGRAAFKAEDNLGNPAIYLWDGVGFSVVADTSTVAPGHAETFSYFNDGVAVTGDRVYFVAERNAPPRGGSGLVGLYLFSEGQLFKIVDNEDQLQGHNAQSLELTEQSAEGDQVAFSAANYMDDFGGVYRAQVVVGTDLAVEQRQCLNPVAPGDAHLFAINIANLGPLTATGVTLTDTMPSGINYLGATPPGLCSENTGVVTCDLGNVPASTSQQVLIQAQIDAGANGVLTNMVDVTSATSELNAANNFSTLNTLVKPGLIFFDGSESCSF